MLETTLILALVLTLGVGLLLGLVGGGGSIVMVPILVYVLGLQAFVAIAMSLPIVGATSLVGAIVKARKGEVHGRALLLFGLAGAVGALIGSRFTKQVPQPFLLLLFAVLLFAVGLRMWFGRGKADIECDNECRSGRCVVAGWGVGLLTGFLGVGGGFFLVPALRRFANQTMKLATGTSLGIIALNSASGVAGHWGEVRTHLPLTAALTGMALVGLFAGLKMAGHVPARTLEKSFAGVAISVATYLVFTNLPQAAKLLPA